MERQKSIREKNLQEKLKQEQIAYQKNHVDFPDFEIFNVIKNSRVAKLLIQLRQRVLEEKDLQWLDDIGFANEIIFTKNNSHIAKQHLLNWQTKRNLGSW
ncbi:hypothetical protein ACLKMH_14745 [Psychromonas sp. KJ10-10]|uniref:hypothetical protein n=1 Tax=Psychromonas sp. KJ10-10 TaxID=3391823 RepID=UPI0039B4E840